MMRSELRQGQIYISEHPELLLSVEYTRVGHDYAACIDRGRMWVNGEEVSMKELTIIAGSMDGAARRVLEAIEVGEQWRA